MIPGRATRTRQRPHQAARARERRPERRHVLGLVSLQRDPRTTPAYPRRRTTSDARGGENHGVDIVGWDDAYPGATSRQRGRTARRQRRVPRAQQLGRRLRGRTATSGSPTTTGRSPATRGSAATAAALRTPVVEDVGQLLAHLPVRQAGRHRPLGLSAVRRVWGANRFTATTTQAISAAGFYTLSSSHPVRGLGRPHAEDPHACAPPAPSSFPATPPCRSRDAARGRRRARRSWWPIKLVLAGQRLTRWPSSARRGTWMKGAVAGAPGQSYLSRDGVDVD